MSTANNTQESANLITLYMAYNHNGTKLMQEPTEDKNEAVDEAALYSLHTGNGALVEKCDITGSAGTEDYS